MTFMSTTVRLDAPAVRDIAAGLIHVASDLTALTRPLRLPLPYPAVDALSLRYSRELTYQRRELSLITDAAADDLTLMAETIAAATETMYAIIRWTSLGDLGLESVSIGGELSVSPGAQRPPIDAPSAGDVPRTDDEIVAWAILVATGTAPAKASPQGSLVRELADRTRGCARAVELAWSHGAGPARSLDAFADWLNDVVAVGLDMLADNQNAWHDAYSAAHDSVAQCAGQYIEARAKMLQGQVVDSANTAPASRACELYARVALPRPEVPAFSTRVR